MPPALTGNPGHIYTVCMSAGRRRRAAGSRAPPTHSDGTRRARADGRPWLAAAAARARRGAGPRAGGARRAPAEVVLHRRAAPRPRFADNVAVPPSWPKHVHVQGKQAPARAPGPGGAGPPTRTRGAHEYEPLGPAAGEPQPRPERRGLRHARARAALRAFQLPRAARAQPAAAARARAPAGGPAGAARRREAALPAGAACGRGSQRAGLLAGRRMAPTRPTSSRAALRAGRKQSAQDESAQAGGRRQRRAAPPGAPGCQHTLSDRLLGPRPPAHRARAGAPHPKLGASALAGPARAGRRPPMQSPPPRALLLCTVRARTRACLSRRAPRPLPARPGGF